MPDTAALPTLHEQAAAVLLDPYLQREPPSNYDGWHLIDNADADDVRHALEVAIERLRAVAYPHRQQVCRPHLDYDLCHSCRQRWPCPTQRAVQGG